MSLSEIRLALQQELAATPEYVDFRVETRQAEGRLWRIGLAPGSAWSEHGAAPELGPDERFDGASAWWGGPPKGQARVLTVLPELDQVVLERASGEPPGPGQLLRLYLPQFLPVLIEAWAEPRTAEAALEALAALERPVPVDGPRDDPSPWPALRPAQRRAFALPGWQSSFLWGPPGTGKTTTLAALLAQRLMRQPQQRVLLLAGTHAAVDQAVIALDDTLAAHGDGAAAAARARIRRLGAREAAGRYLGREHLLPLRDPAAVAALARHEAQRPPREPLAAYAAWAEREQALRRALAQAQRAALAAPGLLAMTTMRALFTRHSLRERAVDDRPPFDLIVIDEASQIPLAQVAALLPLGRAVLFAGDPQQLAPVQLADWPEARRWLGRSAFALLPRRGRGHASVVQLDEQSRMAPAIGTLVSALFYEGALRVADGVREDAAWRASRRRRLDGPAQGDDDDALRIEPVELPGGWSAARRGPVRPASAEAIAQRVAAALAQGRADAHEIVVLTPFRAQRALIRQRLAALGVHELRVSTVHRAQGSEAAFVLFDPVDGRLPFLQTEEAERLFNVAFSRAQAQLWLYLADGDAAAPVIARLHHRLRLAGDARPVEPIERLAGAPGFPASALGRRVRIGRHEGEVLGVSPDGRELRLRNAANGAEQAFDVDFLRRRAQGG